MTTDTFQAIFDLNLAISNCGDLRSLLSIIENLTSDFGFNYVLLAARLGRIASDSQPLVVDNHNIKWRHRYESQQYSVIDPTVKYASQNLSPIRWSKMSLVGNQQSLMDEAKDFGHNDGCCIPLHAPMSITGMISLSTSNVRLDKNCFESIFPLLLSVSPTILDMLSRKIKTENIILTDREVECLCWVANGKTDWEISIIIGRSESTVRFHIDNARKKLGTINRNQAVCKALSLGLIFP